MQQLKETGFCDVYRTTAEKIPICTQFVFILVADKVYKRFRSLVFW